jgi:DNA (cytosine-5)-methyltransferase 1
MFDVGNEKADTDTAPSEVPSLAKSFTVASLFAGIGGFDIALEASGAKIAVQCELDPFCRAVLKRHWPSAKLLEDITAVNPSDLAGSNLWTAGFPCQDVSLARGNHGRSGLKGNHTSLFFSLVELLDAQQPEVLVLENVVGLLNSHKGCDFAIILRELTKRGYAVAWRVLNARYFGTPQSRSRVFMVAWKDDFRKALSSLFEPVAGARVGIARKGFITPTSHKKTGAIVPEVAYCVAATSGRHTGNDWARSYISYSDRVRRPTASESERLQGFDAGWTIPLDDYRAPIRGLDSERYHAVGNAVAVPVVKWIANRITAAKQSNSRPSRASFEKQVLEIAPDLKRDSEIVRFTDIMDEVDAATFAYRWKGCGLAFGDLIIEGATAPAPSSIITSKFVELLDSAIPDERYFLTANAAVGILRRADAVGRTLFVPMRKALENMVETVASPPSAPVKKRGENIAKASIRPSSTKQRGHFERVGRSSDGVISIPC